MWIFTTSGFVSAVQDWNDTTMLVVRARDRKSLELLGAAASSEIVHTPTADYPYRLSVGKGAFSTWVAQEALAIDYPNFKSAVSSSRGHDYSQALMDVWSAMHDAEDVAARHQPAEPHDTTIPDWVIRRIQRPTALTSHVVKNATPIFSFGNPSTARVVTIGINPAPSAFSSGAKNPDGSKAPNPLLDRAALSLGDHSTISDADAERIARACYSYFATGIPNTWFNRFEDKALPGVDASYRNGSACHLDLVQWATTELWGSKSLAGVREQFIADDAPFLAQQLASSRYDVIMLDGQSAATSVSALLGLTLTVDKAIAASAAATLKLSSGYFGDTLVLAWNYPLNGRLTLRALWELSEWIRDRFEIR